MRGWGRVDGSMLWFGALGDACRYRIRLGRSGDLDEAGPTR